jgi:PAS domain S-box-containing protein
MDTEPQPKSVRDESVNPEKLRVLVADDSPEFLVAATEFLKKSPRIDTVDMALNGVDALRLATRTNPDLVLVEYKMPELDGPETTEALKKLDKPPRVVVLTAHDDGQCEARANESGADAFLLKDEFHDLMPPLVDRLFQTTGRTAFSTTLGDRIRELNRDATIILIDDDLVTLELVNHLLTEVGYRVFRAKNGADGLALVRQHRPELVLLDVGLPDQSGIDVCRQIKADLSLHHTLVMHLSASHTTEADMKKGLAGGADAYFTLPFKKEQLLARVDSLVRIARLERALSSNQGFYDDLFDKSTFGVAYLTPNGTFETVNQMLRTALGFETWQICGKPLADFATKEDRAGIATAISDVQNNGGSVHRGESRFRCTDGREIWARLTIFPQRDGSGQICHLILLFEDITAQKTSSALQEAMLESIPASIAVLDANGKIVSTNRSWMDHFRNLGRVSSHVGTGANYLDFCQSLDLGRELAGSDVAERIGRVLSREDARFETDYSTGDGRETHWYRTIATPMGGSRDGAIVMHLNITDKHELEDQLRQSQKMDALGQLAGGVAHDFSNLLMVIRCNTDMLMRSDVTADIEGRCTRDIQTAARRASDLTRQLLAFSRRQPIDLRDIDCGKIVRDQMRMLQRLLGESILLECAIPTDLPPVLGDPGMVEQIVMNLAVNARDAMNCSGTLTVCLSAREITPPEGENAASQTSWLELSVRDTGPGIPAALREKIFEPFFTTKEPDKGTGLGLSTVHGIVRQHGGWIEIHTEPDRGAEFRVFLPTADRQLNRTTAQPAPELKGDGQGILIIEDDLDVLNGVGLTLEQVGFKVHLANSAGRATELWHAHRAHISLIIADIILPGEINGEELIGQFRKDNPELKVLLTSGYKSQPVTLRCDDATKFIQKPFSLEELSRHVSQYFDEP